MNRQSYERHEQYAFDSYCKKILKNETRNIYKEFERLTKHEVFIDSLFGKSYHSALFMKNIWSSNFSLK